jgi:uncharacterized protein (UPF0335 family)
MDDPVQGDQLRSIIERIERLEEEKKTISDDIKEIYAEAKGNGYDIKVLRKVVALRKMDANERAEFEAILDLYMQAVGDLADTPLGRAAAPGFASRAPMARSTPSYPERVSRPAETRPGAEAGSAVRPSAPEFPEPDATPAGAVVAARSGVTAGESSGSGYSAATEAPTTDSCSGTGRPNGQVGCASGAAETPAVIPGLAEANAIAARAVIQSEAKRASSGEMPDIPAFLRRAALEARVTPGDQA